MNLIKTNLAGWTIVTLLALGALALTGDEVLQKSQEAMRPGQDVTITEWMTVTKSDGQTDVLELEAYMKGDKSLIRVLAPEDFAGIALLILPKEDGGEETWLYLPAFRNVKQIVAESLSEGFVGSDFAYEDLTARFGDKYDVTAMSEKEGQYLLSLAPKPEANLSYSGARLWADAQTFIPTRVEFDRAGELFKVMTLSEPVEIDGYLTPKRIEMANLKTGSKTTIELLEVQYDTGLEDALFTVRNLKRG